jgi:hypothetical protein
MIKTTNLPIVLFVLGLVVGCGGEPKPKGKTQAGLPEGYVAPQSTDHLPLHDNPDYANWQRFKVGTKVVRKKISKNPSDQVTETQILKLLEVNADKVVLETQITVERPNYPKKENTPFKIEHAAKFRLPANLKLEQFTKPSIKAKEIAEESIKVLGKEYKAKLFTWEDNTESGPMPHKYWESMEFPGRMLKHEAVVKKDNAETSTTEEVIEVVTP